jgi:hypothetical protein
MPISINGSGTISGISVGGLENGCVNEADLATAAVTNTKLASSAVTIDKMGSGEQSGLCKAWVNFNGTGTVAIRASYNVSSITDFGPGDFGINFTTFFADTSYAVVVGFKNTTGLPPATSEFDQCAFVYSSNVTQTALYTGFANSSGSGRIDPVQCNVAIFR